MHNSVITASTGSTSDVSAMHEHEKILVMAFNIVKAHVEFISNVHISADTFILSSGMALGAKTDAGAVTDLTLTATTSVTVVINVPRKTCEKAYYFEYALDTAPTDWKLVGYSAIAKYTTL